MVIGYIKFIFVGVERDNNMEELYEKIQNIFTKQIKHYWLYRNLYIVNNIFASTRLRSDDNDGYIPYFRTEVDVQFGPPIQRQVNNYIQALNRQCQHI